MAIIIGYEAYPVSMLDQRAIHGNNNALCIEGTRRAATEMIGARYTVFETKVGGG